MHTNPGLRYYHNVYHEGEELVLVPKSNHQKGQAKGKERVGRMTVQEWTEKGTERKKQEGQYRRKRTT